VMEQQPGPVNWAPWNPAPFPGAVRLWAWEAFAARGGSRQLFSLASGAVRARTDACGAGLVVIPGLFTWSQALIEAIRAHEGHVLIGPRSGSKTADFAIPEALPPALPDDILSVRVSRIETLRADTPVPVKGVGTFKFWREYLEVGAGTGTVLSAEDGVPALVAKGNHYYLGGWPDKDLLLSILRGLCEQTGLAMRELPDGVRLRRHGQHVFALNYGAEPFDLADIGWSRDLLLGEAVLAPSGVAVARLTDAGY
jgi:beta-galactosidase